MPYKLIAASSTSFTVPPGQLVRFGDPDLGDVGTALAVGVLASPPAAGTTARVTLTFQNAGTVTIDAPVVDGAYAGTTATSAPVAAGG